jgi:hypothetical protein
MKMGTILCRDNEKQNDMLCGFTHADEWTGHEWSKFKLYSDDESISFFPRLIKVKAIMYSTPNIRLRKLNKRNARMIRLEKDDLLNTIFPDNNIQLTDELIKLKQITLRR